MTNQLQKQYNLIDSLIRERDELRLSLELAWGLIANAYGGDWDLAPSEWKEAATRWRDEHWHPALKNLSPEQDDPSPEQRGETTLWLNQNAKFDNPNP